jgi:hypothetical protein
MGFHELGRPPTELPAMPHARGSGNGESCGLRSSSTYGDEIGDSRAWKSCAPPRRWVFTRACSSVRFVLLFCLISSSYLCRFSVGCIAVALWKRYLRNQSPRVHARGQVARIFLNGARGCRWRARMWLKGQGSLHSGWVSLVLLCDLVVVCSNSEEMVWVWVWWETLCHMMLCFPELDVFMLSSQWVFSSAGYPSHLFPFVWMVIWITMVYVFDTTWQLRFICARRMRSESLTQSPYFLLSFCFQFWNSTDVISVLYTPCCLARITYWTSPW